MRSSFIISFVFFSCFAFAQQELGISFLENSVHTNLINPAKYPDAEMQLGLPTVHFNFSSAFSYNNVIKPGDDGKFYYNFDEAVARLKTQNNLQLNLEASPISFGYNIKDKVWVNFHMVSKLNSYTSYPKTLLDMAWNGNAGYIGETVNIAPRFQTMHYQEFGLGAAYKIDKLSIGARIKYLNGSFDISSTGSEEITIYTDEDAYQLDIHTDYAINTSNLPTIAFDSLNNALIDPFQYRFFGGNTGIAADLGMEYQFDEKMKMSISVVDLGFVNWTKESQGYINNNDFNWGGLDLAPYLFGDTIDLTVIVDSIDAEYAFQNLPVESYKTNTPLKFYYSFEYKLLEQDIKLGAMYLAEFNRGVYNPGIALNATKGFGDKFSLGLSYSWRNQSFTNVGLNCALKLGKFNWYLHSDNFPALIRPWSSRNMNVRTGIILSWDTKKEELIPTEDF